MSHHKSRKNKSNTPPIETENSPSFSGTTSSVSYQQDNKYEGSPVLSQRRSSNGNSGGMGSEHHSKQNGHHRRNSAPKNGQSPNASEVANSTLLIDQLPATKKRNFITRTITTFLMIGGFFGIIAAGHVWVIMMVVAIQTMVYKEVIQLAQVPSREKKLPWFKAVNWYFLVSTNYFLYGESLIYYFKQIIMVDRILLPFATHHRFISFVLYLIGFVFFVANLKKGHYKFQFQQFCWTHMALFLVIVQSHFMINNIFEGMIWFFLPVSLVITNDIFAYICGFFWGRTPLIKLSPKKTVEGFVGGWICTVIFAGLVTTLLSRWDYMICPVKDLSASAFSNISCEPKNPIFIPVPWELTPWLRTLLSRIFFTKIRYITIKPIMFHALFMACFASLIAPFGGFFASGVKRAFKIKDFGQSIPGHGGMTDRMDCQFLMGLFSYMYYQSFIKTYSVTIGSVLQTIIYNLSPENQILLLNQLTQYLVGQEVIDQGVADCVTQAVNERGI